MVRTERDGSARPTPSIFLDTCIRSAGQLKTGALSPASFSCQHALSKLQLLAASLHAVLFAASLAYLIISCTPCDLRSVS
jgi:hypothetical protein